MTAPLPEKAKLRTLVYHKRGLGFPFRQGTKCSSVD